MPDATLYVFGDFRLDAGRRLLSHRSQGAIPITSRAFDTLLHLVRNPGRLIPKRELMDAVWADAVVEENNLTQTISTLRQLLGERPDDHRYIVTVSGRGYRFIANIEPDADAPTTVAAPPAASFRRIIIVVAIAGLAVAVGIAALLSGRFASKPRIESIAVLPFKPVVQESGDPALELGMADTLPAALAEFEKARALSAANSEAVSMVGYTLARSGDRNGAQAVLTELLGRSAQHYVPPFNIAMLYNGLGDTDNAFAWLDKAYVDRDVRLTFLKIEKKWDPLRADERFASLAKRMKL